MNRDQRNYNLLVLGIGGIGFFLLVRGVAMFFVPGLIFNGLISSLFGYGLFAMPLGLPPFHKDDFPPTPR